MNWWRRLVYQEPPRETVKEIMAEAVTPKEDQFCGNCSAFVSMYGGVLVCVARAPTVIAMEGRPTPGGGVTFEAKGAFPTTNAEYWCRDWELEDDHTRKLRGSPQWTFSGSPGPGRPG